MRVCSGYTKCPLLIAIVNDMVVIVSRTLENLFCTSTTGLFHRDICISQKCIWNANSNIHWLNIDDGVLYGTIIKYFLITAIIWQRHQCLCDFSWALMRHRHLHLCSRQKVDMLIETNQDLLCSAPPRNYQKSPRIQPLSDEAERNSIIVQQRPQPP